MVITESVTCPLAGAVINTNGAEATALLFSKTVSGLL